MEPHSRAHGARCASPCPASVRSCSPARAASSNRSGCPEPAAPAWQEHWQTGLAQRPGTLERFPAVPRPCRLHHESVSLRLAPQCTGAGAGPEMRCSAGKTPGRSARPAHSHFLPRNRSRPQPPGFGTDVRAACPKSELELERPGKSVPPTAESSPGCLVRLQSVVAAVVVAARGGGCRGAVAAAGGGGGGSRCRGL